MVGLARGKLGVIGVVGAHHFDQALVFFAFVSPLFVQVFVVKVVDKSHAVIHQPSRQLAAHLAHARLFKQPWTFEPMKPISFCDSVLFEVAASDFCNERKRNYGKMQQCKKKKKKKIKKKKCVLIRVFFHLNADWLLCYSSSSCQ